MKLTTLKPTETGFQKTVTDYATLRGWLWQHQRPARTLAGWRTAVQGSPGFPDLCLVRRDRLVFAELKVGRNKTTPAQASWTSALTDAGVEVYVWWPEHWPEIIEVLA